MNIAQEFNLSGIAMPLNAESMLDEICEHFVEHSDVERTENFALLKSGIGVAGIQARDGKLFIELTCPTEKALQMTRNIIAEHLFFFAGDDPLELNWSDPAPLASLPDIHPVTVVSAEDITPHMRRVKFACADVTPFIGGGMHVRLLIPPKGRPPVWPGLRPDGRIAWPEGDDELHARVYTIRFVDVQRRELWIDFLQHQTADIRAPGARFARETQAGETVALLGPGGGSVPQSGTILLAGDETALPAIARIAAEVPPGTSMHAIIEVMNAQEEQPLPSAGTLTVHWLRRGQDPAGGTALADAVKGAIALLDDDAYIWVGCEKVEARAIRAFLKGRKHDKRRMYVAWFWEKE